MPPFGNTNTNTPTFRDGDVYGRKSVHSRCDLTFSVARCARLIRRDRNNTRIGLGAAIFAAAVLEFLTAEILLLAGDAAEAHKKKTILPRHIMIAMRTDEEFSKLFHTVLIAEAGVPLRFPSMLRSQIQLTAH